jgi:hypothetical protein
MHVNIDFISKDKRKLCLVLLKMTWWKNFQLCGFLGKDKQKFNNRFPRYISHDEIFVHEWNTNVSHKPEEIII